MKEKTSYPYKDIIKSPNKGYVIDLTNNYCSGEKIRFLC